MMNADNNKNLTAQDIAEHDLAAVFGGRFKEEDVDSINIVRGYFIERYPDKVDNINYIFSLIENDPREFSYSEVVNMVASLLNH